jgi:hypothetical protein
MTDEQQEVVLPTIYEYCARAYQAMKEEASTENLGPQFGDEEGLVWDGFSTQVIKDLDLPVPYYSKVFGELKRMDCIRQLRRGGSTTTSRWLLMQDPTPELFMKMPADRTPKGSKVSMQQQINDLNNRMGKVEEALGI